MIAFVGSPCVDSLVRLDFMVEEKMLVKAIKKRREVNFVGLQLRPQKLLLGIC
jgi:hypothetical protein